MPLLPQQLVQILQLAVGLLQHDALFIHLPGDSGIADIYYCAPDDYARHYCQQGDLRLFGNIDAAVEHHKEQQGERGADLDQVHGDREGGDFLQVEFSEGWPSHGLLLCFRICFFHKNVCIFTDKSSGMQRSARRRSKTCI